MPTLKAKREREAEYSTTIKERDAKNIKEDRNGWLKGLNRNKKENDVIVISKILYQRK